MEGSGTVSDLGELNLAGTFKFNLVLGEGYDFVTTFTGTSSSDNFSSTGTSKMQQDGSFDVTETLSNGKGKFEKIKGGGEAHVVLINNNTVGTGEVSWTVSY